MKAIAAVLAVALSVAGGASGSQDAGAAKKPKASVAVKSKKQTEHTILSKSMTPSQVKRVLGKPKARMESGPRTRLVYIDGSKLTFRNGKLNNWVPGTILKRLVKYSEALHSTKTSIRDMFKKLKNKGISVPQEFISEEPNRKRETLLQKYHFYRSRFRKALQVSVELKDFCHSKGVHVPTEHWIGCGVCNLATVFKRKKRLPYGAVIAEVASNGPGQRAGLQPDDILMEIDGKPILGADYFFFLIAHMKAKSKHNLVYLRPHIEYGPELQLRRHLERRRTTVVVQDWPTEDASQKEVSDAQDNYPYSEEVYESWDPNRWDQTDELGWQKARKYLDPNMTREEYAQMRDALGVDEIAGEERRRHPEW